SIRRVEAAPWPVGSELDYVIRLRIERFEGVSPEEEGTEGEALVVATWDIAAGADRAVLARGTTEYRAPGWAAGDYEGLVDLLEAGLGVVASDLVARLEQLRGEAPRP
ncbi:MAG TPA: ABC-type transport auxiliary lipoprotein family protein, partial [Longimicrobiales bacterium]